MKARKITNNISLLGAIDWNRTLFDSLIPLPHGTSYNAYLVKGKQKTALLDAADPSLQDQLMEQLEEVPTVDYVIAHHAEQDHSGALPLVMAKYPQATLVLLAESFRDAAGPPGPARRPHPGGCRWRNAGAGRGDL